MARNNNAFSLGPMLEKEKLAANGGNYADWFHNLGFVLKVAKKDYVLKEALPPLPLRMHRKKIRTSMRLKWMTTPQYNA